MTECRPKVQDFTVGWISALPLELEAGVAMLDEKYESSDDIVQYVLGRIGRHNVVLGCLPKGQIGTNSAAVAATRMQSKFPSLQIGLMVGIGGGVSSSEADVRLGDVVVSSPQGVYGGVVQYYFGKTGRGGVLTQTGSLSPPPTTLLTAIALLQADRNAKTKVTSHLLSSNIDSKFKRCNAGPDILYLSSYNHVAGVTCAGWSKDMIAVRTLREIKEEFVIHYGTIASGNQVIKDGTTRDCLSTKLGGVLCFEMEAAGLMNSFPCLVIREVCDYADSHKNKQWQPFAAIVTAACAKEVLSLVSTVTPDLSTEDLEVSNMISPLRRREIERMLSSKSALSKTSDSTSSGFQAAGGDLCKHFENNNRKGFAESQRRKETLFADLRELLLEMRFAMRFAKRFSKDLLYQRLFLRL